MLSTDLRAINALMDMRLDEARQRAETRYLRQQAGHTEHRRVHQQSGWLLCQVGQLLTAMGQRLEQIGLPGSFPIES